MFLGLIGTAYDLLCIRAGNSNTHVGRLICRLVSMFDTVQDLVDEKDRRSTLNLRLEEEEEEGMEDPIEHSLT